MSFHIQSLPHSDFRHSRESGNPSHSPTQLTEFLIRQFGHTKGHFLSQHGNWWHQAANNRFIVQDNASNAIAAYYAITPMEYLLDHKPYPSLWWIDLVVDPTFRRCGLQTLMDDSVRTRPGLKFGIPNAFHATILQKHGWAIRNDFRKCLLPLNPMRIRSVQTTTGTRGILLKSVATLLRPLLAALRTHWARYTPTTAQQIINPTPEKLATIPLCPPNTQLLTTHRHPDFLRWRYFDCPYKNELSFYTAGPTPPSLYAITRLANLRGIKTMRILDLFGDLTSPTHLRDLLKLIIRDAIHQQADQLTILSSPSALPQLQTILQSQQFWITVPIHFCWHTPDTTVMEKIAHTPCYWTLADSDNDEPH